MARASAAATGIDVRRAASTTKSWPSPFILRKGMVALPDMAHIWRGGSKRQSNELRVTSSRPRQYSRHNEQPAPRFDRYQGPDRRRGLRVQPASSGRPHPMPEIALPQHANFDPPLSKASRRLLMLSIATPRPCPWGPSCICLTLAEGRALRRVAKIARRWKRQVRRDARQRAQERLETRED